ncbi:hypothetical protein Tco_0151841 [Tanacetum coccineum]
MEVIKSLGKDEEGEDVDVHLYRFQVTPKVSHLHAVKRIFRTIHDRRSTSGGCQYLGRRLVSWQCKKQTIVAISSTEAEYVAAASCCAQVLWMQNQLLDYGFNFMNTEIHIDNESTICIVRNPVLHSKTKHIQIRHHFIRDCYEQRLINVVKVHTDDNVADLLTKGFDLARLIFGGKHWLMNTATLRGGSHVKYWCTSRITLDSPMLVVVTACVAAEEEQSTVTYKQLCSSREVRRLKRQTISQAKQIIKLKAKLKKLSKGVKPLVKHHLLWVRSQKHKTRGKKHKKKVSSVKLGRLKDEGTLSEEHYVQEDYTADHFLKWRILEELDWRPIHVTARQSTVTPRTLNFDDEAGPSSPIRQTQDVEPEEQFKVDEVLADISRPRGLSIPGPIQSQPQQSTQATDPKDKGKGILVEEPKKKKLTLQQIRALETTNDEEVARKIQAEWDAEEERKRLEELKKAKPKTILKKPTSLAQERNQMMNFLKGQGYKNLQKLRYPQMKELYDKVQESIKDSFKDFIPNGLTRNERMCAGRDEKRLLRKRKATISEEQPSKKLKLRTETIDALRNYLRIVDFEHNVQDKESLEAISVITEFKDLYLYIGCKKDYYEHIPPTSDLTTIWETPETSDDDFWKNQADWEIIRWRLNESSGVHTLELEDGTMIHMLAERRYPLSRELMIRMLDHGMEVEDESETAITLIHLFILWTTESCDILNNWYVISLFSLKVSHGLLPFLGTKELTSPRVNGLLDTQTDCIQDTTQKMKLKRLKTSIATMTKQTDDEQDDKLSR